MDARRLRQLTIEERERLVELLTGLDETGWRQPTACPGWSVRDVLAHLVAWDDVLIHHRFATPAALVRWARAMTRSRFDPDRFNLLVVERTDSGPDLLRRFRDQATGSPRWLFERLAPGAQLAEYVVHRLDLASALSQAAPVPDDVLRAALLGVTRVPGIDARARLRRQRWTATDVDWSEGSGPETRAPAVEILRSLAGRTGQ